MRDLLRRITNLGSLEPILGWIDNGLDMICS
jgi:hypothetical protein